ncbi:DUF4396 domain-containing protein [Methylocella sp.]|uniref:DUF4396 domain-containing protein n=1 Tax=Methylocella sp. TaxID=1978226 RepID=UPI003784FAD2
MTAAAFPSWLVILAIISLLLAILCVAFIVIDETRRPQRRWVMNLVWPLTTLFGGPLWLAFYARWGRAGAPPAPAREPVARGLRVNCCGVGVVLGNFAGETLALVFPQIAPAFGFGTLFKEPIFAVWAFDLVLALAFGLAIQAKATPRRTISEIVRSDAILIVVWQLTVFAAMGGAQFFWLRPAFGGLTGPGDFVFWFVLQIAMLCGFAAAFFVGGLFSPSNEDEKMRA